MSGFIKTVLFGFLISFAGSLPFGTLNLTAFEIAASKGVSAAFTYSIAVVLVELVAVRISLYGNERFNLSDKFYQYALPFGIILLIYLSFNSFSNVMGGSGEIATKSSMFFHIESVFLLGFLLSLLNPLHIPFWMTWNKVLSGKGLLKKSTSTYIGYMVAIGTGALLALSVFILAGNYVFAYYDEYQKIISFSLGLLYFGFSVFLIYTFFKRRYQQKVI